MLDLPGVMFSFSELIEDRSKLSDFDKSCRWLLYLFWKMLSVNIRGNVSGCLSGVFVILFLL